MGQAIRRIAVMTSGGDAPGMNAAVRSIVRAGITYGLDVYAIREGYEGLIKGGTSIHPIDWDDVGGILHHGGTVIGTARSKRFQTREGRLQAALHVIQHELDALAVIGGDGSLTGALVFHKEWPGLVADLLKEGKISEREAKTFAQLSIVGLPGTIDNDMYGTDMTIGADSALHRITAAADAISSTAASHQRTFVIEVMGRNCGYLALMGALATGADWVLIPESPVDPDTWQEEMCLALRKGRAAGRRDSIVIVAEGARDTQGRPISSSEVRKALETHLQEEARLTVLGHVQRGGTPSAFDRNLGTILGYEAVCWLLNTPKGTEPHMAGIQGNQVQFTPIEDILAKNHDILNAIRENNVERAIVLRGTGFEEAYRTFHMLVRAAPSRTRRRKTRLRLGVMHVGAPAPGMNAAVRAAVRLALDEGYEVVGIYNGFRGLIHGDVKPLEWMSVRGWTGIGGALLGTNRILPRSDEDYRDIAQTLGSHQIDGLLVIGGWWAYKGVHDLYLQRFKYPAIDIPLVAIPATIDNNLPYTDLSIGADTALNSIMWAVDRIKESAVAVQRVFVVEVMGRDCGYLALMASMATGAERAYLPEEGITLELLEEDLRLLADRFRRGKRLGLLIRNEKASDQFTTQVITAILEAEGKDLFDARYAILGHLQQGGNPMPFDRILATRMGAHGMKHLIELALTGKREMQFLGRDKGHVVFYPFSKWGEVMERSLLRPQEQWWLELRNVVHIMARRRLS